MLLEEKWQKQIYPLAISSFLRQHNLVQVQWVFLSNNCTPARWHQFKQRIALMQEQIMKFESLLVLVGGGSLSIKLLKKLYASGADIIAADGGARACKKAGIIPKAIIGDMDSLKNKKQWQEKSQLIELKEQETTDFEKCLYSTDSPLTIALGMTGDWLDHTLNAFDIMAKYACERHIILIDKKDMAFATCGEFSLNIGAGKRVSIHPLGKVKFEKSISLKFPLTGITLAPKIKSGISNKTISDSFSIKPEQGNETPYLVIINKKHLNKAIAKLMQP